MLETIRQELIRIWPTAALFFAVLIGGLIVSAIARRVVRWAIEKSGLDALAERVGAARLLYAIGVSKGVSHLVGTIVWVAGLLITAAAAGDILGLNAISEGSAAIIGFLPRIVAGGLVLLGGAGLAGLVRRVAVGFARRRNDVEHPELLGNLAYYCIMTLAAVVAADQAGIETALIETLLVTFAAITGAAIAFAFALGSRHSFHNLVAGHFLRRLARPGDRVQIGGVEGTVIRYFGVSVILKTATGEVAVPCKRLLDENVALSRLGAKAQAKFQAEGGDPSEIE